MPVLVHMNDRERVRNGIALLAISCATSCHGVKIKDIGCSTIRLDVEPSSPKVMNEQLDRLVEYLNKLRETLEKKHKVCFEAVTVILCDAEAIIKAYHERFIDKELAMLLYSQGITFAVMLETIRLLKTLLVRIVHDDAETKREEIRQLITALEQCMETMPPRAQIDAEMQLLELLGWTQVVRKVDPTESL